MGGPTPGSTVGGVGSVYGGIAQPLETEKTHDNVKLLPMSTKASSNGDTSIEYGKQYLPPAWVDI